MVQRYCYPGKCVWVAKDSHHRLMYIKPPLARGRYYTPKYSDKFDDWAKQTLGQDWFNLLEQHQLKGSEFSCGALVIWNRFKRASHLLSSSKIIFPTERGLKSYDKNCVQNGMRVSVDLDKSEISLIAIAIESRQKHGALYKPEEIKNYGFPAAWCITAKHRMIWVEHKLDNKNSVPGGPMANVNNGTRKMVGLWVNYCIATDRPMEEEPLRKIFECYSTRDIAERYAEHFGSDCYIPTPSEFVKFDPEPSIDDNGSWFYENVDSITGATKTITYVDMMCVNPDNRTLSKVSCNPEKDGEPFFLVKITINNTERTIATNGDIYYSVCKVRVMGEDDLVYLINPLTTLDTITRDIIIALVRKSTGG